MNAIVQDSHRQILRLMQARQPQDALRSIDDLLRREAGDPRLWLLKAQCLLTIGRLPEACAAAGCAMDDTLADPALLDALGTVFSRANDQQRALAAYNRAIAQAPNQAHFLFNRAAVRRFLGDLAAAESDYDRAIALRPDDCEAYANRSQLRTQTRERNHVAEMEALLAGGTLGWEGEVEMRHALAKEYEDLGEYPRSFEHLRRGATLRRRHLRYTLANDVATVDWIIQAFPKPLAAARPDAATQACAAAPIFVIGLPRSGSTLVERILSSHSAVESAGELHHFSLALVDAVQRHAGAVPLNRQTLVAKSAELDFAALGADYLARVRAGGCVAARFVDKMPLNYLYCGLIQRALPQARIVHVSREPMAACYAMYKTLFKDGYPFSYDVAELAGYYAGYRRLMQHWHATLPEAIFELQYEALVAAPEAQTRRLLSFCGLEWQQRCSDFHLNPAASTTASAAQVRQPLYRTSLSQWRHYARELAPLRDALIAAGIAVGAEESA
jgi:tetratricopeptide (TPR) repeat protein